MTDVAIRLAACGVATLHEANDRTSLLRGLDLLVGAGFAGPAETVAIATGDNLGIHLALESAEPGSVLCVASDGNGVYGVIGDLIVEAARARGLAALVVDDGIRDLAELEPPPAIAARGVSARGTVKRRVRSLGVPVAVGGVLVAPGDWVVGDRDGVCVVQRDRLDAMLARAGARIAKEDALRRRLRAGETTVSALGLEGRTA